MSNEISFPVDNMRRVAQQIENDTEALAGVIIARPNEERQH